MGEALLERQGPRGELARAPVPATIIAGAKVEPAEGREGWRGFWELGPLPGEEGGKRGLGG